MSELYFEKTTHPFAVPANRPHITLTNIPGGNRQGVPVDSWGIVITGLPKRDWDQVAHDELITTVPKSDGIEALIERLHAEADHRKLHIDNDVLKSIRLRPNAF